MPLILASSSPRRKEIIGLLRLPYDVVVATVYEKVLPGEPPLEMVKRLALAKAKAAATQLGGEATIVGADTIVVLDGTVLGKPDDAIDATLMLRLLRDRDHEVITGVAVLDTANGRQRVTATTSIVTMRNYPDAEIAAYIRSGEAFDKAGGYAVQSKEFHPATEVKGCYLNVVGLPLCTLAASLCAVGFHVNPIAPAALAPVCQYCEHRDILLAGCT